MLEALHPLNYWLSEGKCDKLGQLKSSSLRQVRERRGFQLRSVSSEHFAVGKEVAVELITRVSRSPGFREYPMTHV